MSKIGSLIRPSLNSPRTRLLAAPTVRLLAPEGLRQEGVSAEESEQ